MSNVSRLVMIKEKEPISEGEALDSFLAELDKGSEVKEIAGWESGFPELSRLLNGISPGLYLLIGPPACGKTTFAKQLCDQVVQRNSIPAIFVTFTERKRELRIMTLARLSGLENREIRRGSAFLLHWYGMPRARIKEADQMAPSWEKLKKAAEGARGWLDLVYIFEGSEKRDLQEVEDHIRRVQEIKGSQQLLVIIDDSQRLAPSDQYFDARLALVAEQLQGLAVNHQVAVIATWPDLGKEGTSYHLSPWEWAERVANADAVLVMENDVERTKKLTEPNRAVTLHIAKNRDGEKGTVAFDFFPAVAKFLEATPGPSG